MRAALPLAMLLVGCAPNIDPGPIPAERAKAPVPLITLPADDGPVVHFQAVVRAGSALDPIGQEGLAHLTARALTEAGAGGRSSTEVRQALYPTGNQFDSVISREWISVRLRCHVDHAALCLELFADALTVPTFDPGDVIRLRELAEQHVTEDLLASEERLGEEVFEATLYEGHPYGHPVQGRAGVLPTLGADDARAFHATHYVREAMFVGLAGHWDDDLRDALSERLEAVPGEPAPELVPFAPAPVEGRSLVAVDVDNAVTGFHFGHPLQVGRDHEDWAALTLAMTALGAHRQSFGRLFRRMRTDRGLNYGDYAYIEPYVQRGWGPQPEQGVLRSTQHFYVWVRPTSLDNGPFALKLAIDEVERLVDEGLEPDELDDVRDWLSGAVALWATDAGRRLAFRLDAEATDTPNLLESLPTALETLDAEQVHAALRRHIRPDDLVIVGVSGEADDLATRLVEDDATPVVYDDATDETTEPAQARATRDATLAEKDLGLEQAHTWVVSAQGIFR